MECPFFSWPEFGLGFMIGGLAVAFTVMAINRTGWPSKDQRNAVLHFFSQYQRLRRKGDRLQHRIWRMGQMKDRRVEIKNARNRIAELEQQLGPEALDKPQEFLDTE